MALRYVLFFWNKEPPSPPSTTPDAIQRAKCVTLLRTYAIVVGVLLLSSRVFLTASVLSLFVTGVVLFATLCAQGLALLMWARLDAWKVPLSRLRNRVLRPARLAVCLLAAPTCVASLMTGQPTTALGVMLGVLWWILWERHEYVMRGVQHGSEIPHQHRWAAFCFYGQTIVIWIKRVWRECAIFPVMLVVMKVLDLISLPQWSAWTRILVHVVMLTVVWMYCINLFHEVLNSRYEYGDCADPKTFVKVVPSIRSDLQIPKRCGFGYLKWVVSAGNGIGQEYRKALFTGEASQLVWSECARACCAEIDALADCIINSVGHVPDISAPMLFAKKEAVYGIGLKIQHKYALMSRCLGCLCGMLCAATEEDTYGTAKYGNPGIGNIMTTIFEAHFLLRYFCTTGAPLLELRFPFGEIWAPKSLLLEFERTHLSIWKYYGTNLFVQMNRAPRFLSAPTLLREIGQFTGARTEAMERM